jgi:aminoglycoside phosphotransferase (APT) family kinase protein
MAAPSGRDPEATAGSLGEWLARRLDVSSVDVSDLKIPKAGFSNETIMGTARWTDAGAEERERRFVLRIEPSSHQLFQEADAIRQASVMQGLAGHVPVPEVWLTESDPSVFGTPFFLMDHVDGRIPSDFPSWHERGWTTTLEPDERARLYDNGIAAMVQLHRVDWRGDLAFLEPAGSGSALDRYIEHVERWYEWCAPSRRFGADTIDAAMEHVIANRPDDDGAQVSWGDARPGNIVFADDFSVAAMLDWEGATIGPPGIDVGWWLMFEEFLCEAQGLKRLEGVAGRDETIARYEELSGQPLIAIRYYEIVAGLVFAMINSRLADLLIAGGKVDPDFAASVVTRVTDMVAHWLSDSD